MDGPTPIYVLSQLYYKGRVDALQREATITRSDCEGTH